MGKIFISISLVFIVFLFSQFSFLNFHFSIPKVLAQSTEELSQKLRSKQEEIARLEAQLESARTQEKSLKKQLDLIDGQTKITELRIEETNLKIEKLKREITDLSGRIERISSSVDKLSQILLERIVKTYKYSSVSTLDLLFSSHSLSETLERLKYIQTAQANDKKVLYELQATKATYNDQKQDRQTRQAEAEKLNDDLENYKKQLAEQKTAKEDLLRVTRNDEARYQALIAQLRADTDSIRRALSGAGVKKGHVNKGDVVAVVGNSGCSTGAHLHFEVMTNARVEGNTVIGRENKTDPKPFLDSGQFSKPLDSYHGGTCSSTCHNGDISALYGASGDSYIKGFPPHTGLDIAEKYGTPIRAVADGEAYEFSDSGACYLTGTVGRGVVIDHDDSDYVTLYWHIP